MLEQIRNVRSVRGEPRLLPFPWRAAVEHFVAQIGERMEVARRADGEPEKTDVTVARLARGKRIAPRDVIAGAGGEDGDLVSCGEPAGDLPAVDFRSASDFGTVSLDDEGELHRPSKAPDSRICFRSAAFSIASSWMQANSTWLTRRCRSKLSRLYSNSHRNIGIRTRRLKKSTTAAAPEPRWD